MLNALVDILLMFYFECFVFSNVYVIKCLIYTDLGIVTIFVNIVTVSVTICFFFAISFLKMKKI